MYEIKKANEMVNEFKLYLKKDLKFLEEDLDDDYFFVKHAFENFEKIDSYHVCLKDNIIIGFLLLSEEPFGKVVQLQNNYNIDAKLLIECIKVSLPNIIIDGDSNQYSLIEEAGYIPMKLESSFDDDKNYHVGCNCNTYWTLDENNVYLIRDYIENLLFPKVTENFRDEITFKVFTKKEIYDWYVEKYKDTEMYIPKWIGKSGHYVISGFHYFDFGERDDVTFHSAMYKGNIIGVIKIQEHTTDGMYFKTPYQSVNFIDVAAPYKNKGIATMMIKELNHQLQKDLLLFVTQESKEGKEVGISEIFKKNITSTKVIAYKDNM